MPRTHVVSYREDDERVPVLDWLKELRASDHRAYETCVAAIERLGSRTKKAGADFLRDGIHELRVRKGRMNYRILYFFHGRNLSSV